MDAQQTQLTVTRIDLETAGSDGIFKRSWLEGWKEGDSANQVQFLPGRTLLALLKQAEERGWSVTQFNNNEARLLRGEITRVDFTVIPAQNAVRIDRYPYGWTARTRPMQSELRPGSLSEVTDAFEAENPGWIVRDWIDGARAWKDQLLPVRDMNAILALRNRFNLRPRSVTSRPVDRRLDFAYDL